MWAQSPLTSSDRYWETEVLFFKSVAACHTPAEGYASKQKKKMDLIGE